MTTPKNSEMLRSAEAKTETEAGTGLEATSETASGMPLLETTEIIPEEVALEIRRLAHDLSNALEIIVQTSYLLSTSDLKEPASTWLGMLDSGVMKCLNINTDLRNYIKHHAAK
jgi:hypothetical protein